MHMWHGNKSSICSIVYKNHVFSYKWHTSGAMERMEHSKINVVQHMTYILKAIASIYIITFINSKGAMLNIPIAGSMSSSLSNSTCGWNHAHDTCTHRLSTFVGFNAPPTKVVKVSKKQVNDYQNAQSKRISQPDFQISDLTNLYYSACVVTTVI